MAGGAIHDDRFQERRLGAPNPPLARHQLQDGVVSVPSPSEAMRAGGLAPMGGPGAVVEIDETRRAALKARPAQCVGAKAATGAIRFSCLSSAADRAVASMSKASRLQACCR